MLGILHYVAHGTDGVSLEIKKREHALKTLNIPYVVLHAKHLDFLNLNSTETLNFLKLDTSFNKSYCNLDILKKHAIGFANKFIRFFKKTQINSLYVHNLFSLPIKPSVSLGLLYAINDLNIKVISINHDFWQTRDYFPKNCKEILQEFPPKSKNIKHYIINSLDAKFLQSKNIKAKVIHDYWDDRVIKFSNVKNNMKNINFANSFVFINASRIIRRKAIENSILFVYWFNKLAKKYLQDRGKQGVLVLSNPADTDIKYKNLLIKLAKQLNVKMIFINSKDLFWNLYKYADVILYTTIQEGFGNQLLEALHFEKPIVLFEYPVFVKDIKKHGFKYISLGNTLKLTEQFKFVPISTIKRAVRELLGVLYQEHIIATWGKQNKKLLEEHYGFNVLLKDLKYDITWLNKTF